MKPFWRRQQLFIDRLQLKLMLLNLLYFAVLSLTFACAIFGPHVYTLYNGRASVEAQQQAADSLLLLHGTVWPPLAVVGLILFYHLMVYSHRIAGPLYRFRSVFAEVRNGNLRARAMLRTSDFLQREAGELNSMIEATESRVEGVANAVDAVRLTAQGVKAGSHGAACYVSLETIEALEARVETVQARLGEFRLASTDGLDAPPVTVEPDLETDSRPTAQV